MQNNLENLNDAYRAWMRCGALRASRARNKQFTYGDQWCDSFTDRDGDTMTDRQRSVASGAQPLTNNLLRQVVRTVVGRYRSQHIDTRQGDARTAHLQLDELDSRAMEEFLISGCVVQRVEQLRTLGRERLWVAPVNVTQFFIDSATDPRGNDCHLLGQLHDLTLAQLLHRVAGGSRRKAQWVRRAYSDHVDQRIAELLSSIGADQMAGSEFWHSHNGLCRAIEVWSRESREVLVCHNRRTAQLSVVPLSDSRAVKQVRSNTDVATRWDVATQWRCRWFSPMGDLLCSYDADARGGAHPFVFRFYPLVDGEVHSFVEGAIDQQKQLNRLITLVNQVMASSAKGVLLFPETALPDGFTWNDVRRAWSNAGGILPYDPRENEARPEQMMTNGTNIGAYDMIQLQMRLLEEVTGVSGALQGKSGIGGNSASLYQAQSENANIALSDVFGTFSAFCRQRDQQLQRYLGASDRKVTNNSTLNAP